MWSATGAFGDIEGERARATYHVGRDQGVIDGAVDIDPCPTVIALARLANY